MENTYDNSCTKLSIVIPCYNEEKSLKLIVERVLEIADENLSLELIIVDDASRDNSYGIACELQKKHSELKIILHEKNSGKGAALRTGFKSASGDYVAIQDADLEYDPMDLKKLLVPLITNKADVVLGSRFLTSEAHRVLYFWHSVGNRFLTLISNMFTDLNLTDMETCYKVFRREVIQSIELKEDRFGFEPEVVAKIAQMRLRIYEIGISYSGRTYAEGKKITAKDGLRALYCIFRYNAHKAPLPLQMMLYLFIGAVSAGVNLLVFHLLVSRHTIIAIAAPSAFITAAFVNYLLCISILFRHKARWKTAAEMLIYLIVVLFGGLLDLGITESLIALSFSPVTSKLFASVSIFFINFLGRRYLVFPEPKPSPWAPQSSEK